MSATKVTTATAVAICLLLAFDQVLGCTAILMQAQMMAEVLHLSALFIILAIVRCHRPTELKRQHDHQEDGNPAAHGVEYMRKVSFYLW